MINSLDFTQLIREIVQEELKDVNSYKLGTIANTNGKPTIKFAGEKSPTQKRYSYLDSYSPVVGDRVLLVKTKGTYVVLGKINQ